MAVNEQASAYSTTAASNTPAGTDTVGPDLDDHLRDIKKNIKTVASHFKGISTGSSFEGAIRADASGTPTVVLKYYGAGGYVNLFELDESALTTAPYFGALPASTFTKSHGGEGTASARNTILGVMGAAANEGTTASARTSFMGTLGATSNEATTASAKLRFIGSVIGAAANEGSTASARTTIMDGISYPGTDGSARQALATDGAGTVSFVDRLVLGTPVETTAGTTVNFTSIPSWVRRITLSFSGVSVSGTDELELLLGDSGGLETSGYVGSVARTVGASSATTAHSSSFLLLQNNIAGTETFSGSVVLTLVDSSSFTWALRGDLGASSTSAVHATAGAKSLSATLDRVQIKTTGSNTFDSGRINILYE